MGSDVARPSDQPLECPACGRRYDAAARFCDACEMPLVPTGPSLDVPTSEAHGRARKIRPELTRGPLVRVAHARNQPEAELLQGLLLEQGVPSLLRRSAGFDVPDFLAAGPRDVLVPESGAELARERLAAAGVEPSRRAAPPTRGQAARVTAAVAAAAGVAALIAWALVHAAH